LRQADRISYRASLSAVRATLKRWLLDRKWSTAYRLSSHATIGAGNTRMIISRAGPVMPLAWRTRAATIVSQTAPGLIDVRLS